MTTSMRVGVGAPISMCDHAVAANCTRAHRTQAKSSLHSARVPEVEQAAMRDGHRSRPHQAIYARVVTANDRSTSTLARPQELVSNCGSCADRAIVDVSVVLTIACRFEVAMSRRAPRVKQIRKASAKRSSTPAAIRPRWVDWWALTKI
jgi:hypothetical protein